MDAFPNDLHRITRKRKADNDDCSVQDPSIPKDAASSGSEPNIHDASATIRMSPQANAESQSTSRVLAQHQNTVMTPWQPSPGVSPTVASTITAADGPSRPKRPRIEIPKNIPVGPPRRSTRGGRTTPSILSVTAALSPRKLYGHARLAGLRDSGMVSPKDPGGVRPGSPLATTSSITFYPSLTSPLESLPSQIPSHQPPINRDTLSVLELDRILYDRQLRHDLLFDSGLHFSSIYNRKKRDVADHYWQAIERELENGCTCITVDSTNGKLRDRVCVCSATHFPKNKTSRIVSPSGWTTIHSPSRLKDLLSELLETFISIINPAPRSNNFGFPASLLRPSYPSSGAHAAELRALIDAEFIQQEVRHNLFDPSGIFKAIGDMMRKYCAPLRDNTVNQMVELAQSCAPGGPGTKADAVRAIRMCFEIMELMKLDIANHQLKVLRPYLLSNARQFELTVFEQDRRKGKLSLHLTRDWLTSVYSELTDSDKNNSSDLIVQVFRHTAQFRPTQVQIAVTKAIINLVFTTPPSPPPPPSALSTQTPPITPEGVPGSPYRGTAVIQPGYPETLYLDQNRLKKLTNDASDYTAMYMLLMLYRQLVHTAGVSHARGPIRPEELLAVKKEICQIGPKRLGRCFIPPSPSAAAADAEKEDPAADTSTVSQTEKEKKWREELNNVILQLTARAGDAHPRTQIPLLNVPAPAPVPSTTSTSLSSTSGDTKSDTAMMPQRGLVPPPNPAMLNLATSWADTNLRHDSPLSNLMRSRIQRLVEERTLQRVVPAVVEAVKKSSNPGSVEQQDRNAALTSGLEPLMPEMNHLADRLAKLVSVHMHVYGALYAQPEFLAKTLVFPGEAAEKVRSESSSA